MRGAPRWASIQTWVSGWKEGRRWSLASFAARCLLGGRPSLLTYPVLRQVGSWNQLGCLCTPHLPLPRKAKLGTMLSFDVSGDQAKQPWTARGENGFRQAAVGQSWGFTYGGFSGPVSPSPSSDPLAALLGNTVGENICGFPEMGLEVLRRAAS